ncbi:MAG: four helix bundle protein [Chitinophagales bacterium]
MEDIKYRAYKFSLNVIKFLKEQNWKDRVNEPFFKLLIRSSTSIGANVIEGRSGNSDKEMACYYRIPLKSANETKYWFCLMRDALEIRDAQMKKLLNEADEISKIIASSIVTITKKLKAKSTTSKP